MIRENGDRDLKEKIWGILSEESLLGRMTSRLWILFGANIMFVLFSLPIVTAGPAWTAMYHVCLKTLRQDHTLNPFKEFWRGFVSDLKQSLPAWLGFLAVIVVLVLDISFVSRTRTIMRLMRWPVYMVTGFILVLLFHFFPVMAAFSDSLKGLIRNSLFFAAGNPIRALLILVLNVAPMVWTYYDVTRMPLYAFLWVTFGFSVTAMAVSKLLLKDFEKYLPSQKVEDDPWIMDDK